MADQRWEMRHLRRSVGHPASEFIHSYIANSNHAAVVVSQRMRVIKLVSNAMQKCFTILISFSFLFFLFCEYLEYFLLFPTFLSLSLCIFSLLCKNAQMQISPSLASFSLCLLKRPQTCHTSDCSSCTHPCTYWSPRSKMWPS